MQEKEKELLEKEAETEIKEEYKYYTVQTIYGYYEKFINFIPKKPYYPEVNFRKSTGLIFQKDIVYHTKQLEEVTEATKELQTLINKYIGK